MTRDQALKLLQQNMENQNLRRHCYAVEAVMKALAKKLGGDEEKWGIVGLLHDGDYEKTKEKPKEHTLLMYQWLKETGETDEEILRAILSHNAEGTGKNPPATLMEWALYCCDELTGLIVATALMMPDKKIATVRVESVMKKMKDKAFAAAVDREQIKMCEEKLKIPLEEFVKIALEAMQGISQDLGL
jgi:putative nucleotidyltransferase with HDIG domain